MCNIKEMTVRDALLEVSHLIYNTNDKDQDSNGRASELYRLVLDGDSQYPLGMLQSTLAIDSDGDISSMLASVVEHIEEYEKNFEPEYIAYDSEPDAEIEAMRTLRLTLMDNMEYYS